MRRIYLPDAIEVYPEDCLWEKRSYLADYICHNLILYVPSPYIALTFDDGPSEFTETILDILASYHLKGNFFVVGAKIGQDDQRVKRIVADGHFIGNHGYNHRDFRELDSTRQKEEIEATNKIIFQYTGEAPRYFRPPGGGYNDDLLDNLRVMEMQLAMWSYDPCDWAQSDCQEIAGSAHCVFSGAVILLHELKQTAAALPTFIEILLKNNFQFATLHQNKANRF